MTEGITQQIETQQPLFDGMQTQAVATNEQTQASQQVQTGETNIPNQTQIPNQPPPEIDERESFNNWFSTFSNIYDNGYYNTNQQTNTNQQHVNTQVSNQQQTQYPVQSQQQVQSLKFTSDQVQDLLENNPTQLFNMIADKLNKFDERFNNVVTSDKINDFIKDPLEQRLAAYLQGIENQNKARQILDSAFSKITQNGIALNDDQKNMIRHAAANDPRIMNIYDNYKTQFNVLNQIGNLDRSKIPFNVINGRAVPLTEDQLVTEFVVQKAFNLFGSNSNQQPKQSNQAYTNSVTTNAYTGQKGVSGQVYKKFNDYTPEEVATMPPEVYDKLFDEMVKSISGKRY